VKTKKTPTRADATAATPTFVDNPALHRTKSLRPILASAEDALAHTADPWRDRESELFKGMHACGYLLRASASVRRRAGYSRARLVTLHGELAGRLVNGNIGLVYDMLRRSPRWSLDDAELVSAGFWALFQSVRAFDPWRGYRFSTYACSAILRSFRHVGRREARQRGLVQALADAEPSSVEIPAREAWDGSPLVDRLRLALERNSADLSPTERFVIQRRFLQPQAARPDTLESLGRMVKLSKERVRQIQLEALAKLRAALHSDPFASTRDWAGDEGMN
jgi:RNA polymerase sigma factor (sigma-70 family)